MELVLHQFELPLEHTFTISRGSLNVQETLIVELRHEGLVGYGEATTNDYYNATIEQMSADLDRLRPLLKEATPDDPPQLWEQTRPLLANNPFAHCALDMAVHDLWGKTLGKPVYELWGLATDNVPVSNYTIGIDSIEFIEQPLAAELRDQMPEVKRHSALPLVADESCIVESDVELCQAGFDVINIKLVKCAGLTPARRMISTARELGLQVMVGCMTESTVGISAIAQLLPLLDFVDMDGAALLSDDIAEGAQVIQGACLYPDQPGCGVTLLKSNPLPVTG